MGQINISNSKGRDALITTRSVAAPLKVRWLDDEGRQVESRKVLKSTMGHDLDSLVAQSGELEKVTDLLIEGDPEVDIDMYGSFLRTTSRVLINPDREIVHKISQYEIVKNPDGSERERRTLKVQEPNIATEIPLKWSGKLMSKSVVYQLFIFSGKIQLIHSNGLTYDFLYNMAKELEEKNSVMLVGAGPKGNQPLIFRHGGTAYRGFLEGRTDGDRYVLVLHLSNMELKAPPKQEE